MGHLLSKYLDLDYLYQLLENIREATGLGVLLIDPHEPSEIDPELICRECALCSLIHSKEEAREKCGREFLLAGREAMRWGEPYFYHCYMGLMEWGIPIITENELIGILTCGQVLIQGKDDLFYFGVLEQTREFGLPDEEVNRAIEAVPVVSGRKVRATAQLLMRVAEQLTEHAEQRLQQARSRQHQQAEIAEALVAMQSGTHEVLKSHQMQKEVIGKVRIGDTTGAKRILNEWLGSVLLGSQTNLSVLKAQVLELVVMLSRAGTEAGADLESILGKNLGSLGTLLNQQTQEDVCHWVLRILENFTTSVFQTRNMERVKMISEGLKYIRENYGDNIMLEDVGRAVGRSGSYFKKILREEMGLSFTEYLTRTRLEASETLLRDPNLSLAEIAQMVGYGDQSYFGKLFKQYYGLTPAQYRKKVL